MTVQAEDIRARRLLEHLVPGVSRPLDGLVEDIAGVVDPILDKIPRRLTPVIINHQDLTPGHVLVKIQGLESEIHPIKVVVRSHADGQVGHIYFPC